MFVMITLQLFDDYYFNTESPLMKFN